MLRTTAAKFVILPACLLGLGALQTAAAQTCGNETCLINAINNAPSSAKRVTINLAEEKTYSLGTALVVSNRVTINGNGSRLTGLGLSNIVQVTGGVQLTLNEVTVDGNGTSVSIFNQGTVTLNNSTVTGAHASFYGVAGGIYNEGTVTLNSSHITDNTMGTPLYFAGADAGGGIYNNQGTVTLNNSTVSGNALQASGSAGGGIFNIFGTVILNNSVVSGNTAGTGSGTTGGGIYNYGGTLTLNQTSVTHNTADSGGGIYNLGGGILTRDKQSNVTSNAGGNIVNIP